MDFSPHRREKAEGVGKDPIPHYKPDILTKEYVYREMGVIPVYPMKRSVKLHRSCTTLFNPEADADDVSL